MLTMKGQRVVVLSAFVGLCILSATTEAKSVEAAKDLPQPRAERDTYGSDLDAKQNVLERLREIENVPDLAEFISSASPCLQPVLAELWQTMQRDAYEKRRRTRYSRAIKRGQSISRRQEPLLR